MRRGLGSGGVSQRFWAIMSSPGKDHDPPWVGGEEVRKGTGVSDGGSGATAATPSSQPPPEPLFVGGNGVREGTGVFDGGSRPMAAMPSSKPPPERNQSITVVAETAVKLPPGAHQECVATAATTEKADPQDTADDSSVPAKTHTLTIKDTQKIYERMFDARVKWRSIGGIFGLSESTHDNIDSENKNNGDKLRKVIIEWLQLFGGTGACTWSQVVMALRNKTVAREDVAREVLEKYSEMISPQDLSLCTPLFPAHDAGEHATQTPHGAPMQQGSLQPFPASEHVTQHSNPLPEDFAQDVLVKHYEMISSQKLPTRKSLCAPLPPAHDAGEHAAQTPHEVPTQGAGSSLQPSPAAKHVTKKPHGGPIPQGRIRLQDLAWEMIDKYSERLSSQDISILKSLCTHLPPTHDAGEHATQTPHGVITHPAPLSEEKAQQIIDKALEASSLELRNVVLVLTGHMGSGKASFLSRVFNQTRPSLYTSTGVTERSCRGMFHHTGTASSLSWDLFSHTDILEMLAYRFRQQLPPAGGIQSPEGYAQPLPLPSPSTPPPTTSPSIPISPSLPPSTSIPTPTSPTHTFAVPQPSSTLTTPLTFSYLTTPLTFSFPSSSSAATPPSVPPTSAKPPTPLTGSATSQSFMRLVKEVPEGFQTPIMLEPELMENMPSLVHNCHLAVLVLNLVYGLDDYPSIDYHQEGKRYRRALPYQYTTRQIIQKLSSTLQSKRFSHQEGQHFRILAVATHKDCVPFLKRKRGVRELDQALREILLPACHKELICLSDSQIVFDLNLKRPDQEDLEKLALIREKVSESGVGEVVQTPGAFLLFEQELVEFSETRAGRSILSLDECLVVGAKLRMSSEMVRAALIFFHRQITFLYFRHVLPDLVFTKPQVPLDCINAIVQFSYKVQSGELKGVSEELTTSLRDGIITEEILGHKLLSKCFVPDLYEPHHAIDLLCHTFTLAPLSRDSQTTSDSNTAVQSSPSTPVEREKREYLMMSLRPAIPDKDVPRHLPPPSKTAPLLFGFTKNCVPLSCFSRTVSCLLAMYDWKLSTAGDGSPQCLAHNVVSLFKPGMPGQIVLVDTFQVHISPGRDTDRNDMSKICFQVKETISTAIKQVFDYLHLGGIEASPAFLCPCPTKPLSHSASLSLFNGKWFLHCSITGESVGAADNRHLMWLEAPATETEKPSLPKLLELNILEAVGTNYGIFGTFLLNDNTCSLVDAIELDCLGETRRIILKILWYWLEGKGVPTTWETLLNVVRKCKLNSFACKIERKYILQ